jgi:hypothetical protein
VGRALAITACVGRVAPSGRFGAAAGRVGGDEAGHRLRQQLPLQRRWVRDGAQPGQGRAAQVT